MILIVGLGNPGNEYRDTRHNFGFQTVNYIAEKFNSEWNLEKKFKAEIAETSHSGQKILFAKPQTFMNKSGEAISLIAQFYKIPAANIWVIFDELDLPFGTYKIRLQGGPGTHNGMKSIVNTLGENFTRWRLGIESRGTSAPAEQETSSFVLSPFSSTESVLLKKIYQSVFESILCALENGRESAMNRFNSFKV